jgi:hypothetical protein
VNYYSKKLIYSVKINSDETVFNQFVVKVNPVVLEVKTSAISSSISKKVSTINNKLKWKSNKSFHFTFLCEQNTGRLSFVNISIHMHAEETLNKLRYVKGCSVVTLQLVNFPFLHKNKELTKNRPHVNLVSCYNLNLAGRVKRQVKNLCTGN